MSARLGIDLWIKRDDLTGFAGSGNKGRKLEYLMADALQNQADVIVTSGAYQSNFVRQLGAACNVFDIHLHAVTMHWPYPDGERRTRPCNWEQPTVATGNAFLNQLQGIQVEVMADSTFDDLEQRASETAHDWRDKGKRVYEIPGGGSSPIGALGFVNAIQEIGEQSDAFDTIVFASGSGGTQSGLAFGAKRANLKTRILGVCTDNEPEMVDLFAEIADGIAQITLTDLEMSPHDFELSMEFCGEGYQVPTPQSNHAIELMAKVEGIFLDPTYTAKAFAGVIEMAKRGELSGRTLFWHTGGFPLLFS